MRGGDQLTFTDFEAKVAAGQVESATIKERDQIVAGELTDGTSYETTFVAEYADELVDELKKAGVTVESDPQAPNELIGTLVTVILPVLLIGGVLLFVMNRSQGGGGRVMQFGRSKHKTVNKDAPKTSFADVAGVDEAIEELQEVKDYLQNPGKFQAMGAKIPRGVLLFGPPGTGKTLLARAVAGEAGVPFFTISGSDFVEMFVGVGAARVRDLFEQAKATAPAIVFIDEIDAVGRQRGAGLGGGHDEREQTLNQLLVEMDGFDQRSTVILMAATNRPDILDPALLRPGRFDRQVVIDRPDLEGRKAILRVHARGKPFDATVDLSVLARRTPGFTGADLANVINEGALLAARRNLRAISMKEIEEAVDRVMAGPERKSRIMDEQERRLIAYHEGGHAMVAHVLPNTDEVHKITVIPRGRALGYTLTLPEQDKFLMSREQMRDELAMLMGGRVAEEIVAGDVTTGAANDIERATKVARQMVTEYGMSDTIGPRTLGVKQGEVFLGRDWGSTPDYSDAMAFEIDQEVRALIDEAHDVALDILTVNRDKLDQLAERLLAVETLERDEVVAFFGEVERRSPREVGVRGAGPGGLTPAEAPRAGQGLRRNARRSGARVNDRWATFDCYGTLVDWPGGIRAQLARLWPEQDADALLRSYHQIEPRIQEGRGIPYRQVMAETLAAVAETADLSIPDGEADALAASLPSWDVFPDVPGSLTELRDRGWKLAILVQHGRRSLGCVARRDRRPRGPSGRGVRGRVVQARLRSLGGVLPRDGRGADQARPRRGVAVPRHRTGGEVGPAGGVDQPAGGDQHGAAFGRTARPRRSAGHPRPTGSGLDSAHGRPRTSAGIGRRSLRGLGRRQRCDPRGDPAGLPTGGTVVPPRRRPDAGGSRTLPAPRRRLRGAG